MMPSEIKFFSVAEQEFIETVRYYNSQSEGLGFEFAAEVKCTLDRIIGAMLFLVETPQDSPAVFS